jgi:hypothetical protein
MSEGDKSSGMEQLIDPKAIEMFIFVVDSTMPEQIEEIGNELD